MSTKTVSLEELRKKKKRILTGLKPVKDEDTNFSDSPELDINDPLIWETLKVCPPVGKEKITIRVDTDVLEWFRKGDKYQSHINRVLRAYFESQLNSKR